MNFTSLRKLLFTIFICQVSVGGWAQTSDPTIAKSVDDLNRKIDKAVVAKDFQILEQHYGDDFVFTHGTGFVDSKKTWIENVKKSKGYVSREHDSTNVELHRDIAIVNGKLTVGRLEPAKDGTSKYSLRYVRVFALRKKNWQMISHRTTSEWHHD